MRPRPIAIALLSIVLVSPAASGAAVAQPAGTLAGSLFDQTGGALVNVTVEVRGPVVRERQSDASGRFEFRDVPPGDYVLRAALAGFESIHRAIPIESGKTLSLSLTMIVASLEQTVVTAAKTGATDVQSSPLAIVRMAKRDKAVDEMVPIASGDDCTSVAPVFAAVTTVCSSDATIIVSERDRVFPDSMGIAR